MDRRHNGALKDSDKFRFWKILTHFSLRETERPECGTPHFRNALFLALLIGVRRDIHVVAPVDGLSRIGTASVGFALLLIRHLLVAR